MSDAKARLQRLEEIVRARRFDLSPAQAWTAIGSLEGNPDLVEKAYRPCIDRLQTLMVNYGHEALKGRLAGLAVPNWMYRAARPGPGRDRRLSSRRAGTRGSVGVPAPPPVRPGGMAPELSRPPRRPPARV
jgi:hypothetical protein